MRFWLADYLQFTATDLRVEKSCRSVAIRHRDKEHLAVNVMHCSLFLNDHTKTLPVGRERVRARLKSTYSYSDAY